MPQTFTQMAGSGGQAACCRRTDYYSGACGVFYEAQLGVTSRPDLVNRLALQLDPFPWVQGWRFQYTTIKRDFYVPPTAETPSSIRT